jgi:transcriptional regulator with XRE-family HTH domain
MEDEGTLLITPEQCREARLLAGLKQTRAATLAHIAQQTLSGYERGRFALRENNLRALQAVFEAAGIVFTKDGGVARKGSYGH